MHRSPGRSSIGTSESVERLQSEVDVGADGLAGGVEPRAGGGPDPGPVGDARGDDGDLEVCQRQVELPVPQRDATRCRIPLGNGWDPWDPRAGPCAGLTDD